MGKTHDKTDKNVEIKSLTPGLKKRDSLSKGEYMKLEEILNTVIQGDCLEVMKQLPDKCVDLVVTSPPYNLGDAPLGKARRKTLGKKLYADFQDNLSDQDYLNWTMEIIGECIRISRYTFWNIQLIKGTRTFMPRVFELYNNNLKDMFIWELSALSSFLPCL